MYIRMVHSRLRDRDTGCRQGVFQAAWDLLESGELSEQDAALLQNLLRWFSANLPGRGSFPKRLHPHAIFWFKASNSVLTAKAWKLVIELRRHDLDVEMLKSRRPGKIVYEDELQVAAVPFADVRKHA